MKIDACFSGYSVDDIEKAKHFYTEVLGLELDNEKMGLQLRLPNSSDLFIYAKDDHAPANYTVLNFIVANIEEAVKELKEKGVTFEIYDNMPGKQDELGIMHGLSMNMGPDIAWFKDPAGNILALLQTQ